MKCVHAREYTQIQTVCEWVFGMRGPAGRCGTQRWQKGGCNIMLHLPHLTLDNRKTTQKFCDKIQKYKKYKRREASTSRCTFPTYPFLACQQAVGTQISTTLYTIIHSLYTIIHSILCIHKDIGHLVILVTFIHTFKTQTLMHCLQYLSWPFNYGATLYMVCTVHVYMVCTTYNT